MDKEGTKGNGAVLEGKKARVAERNENWPESGRKTMRAPFVAVLPLLAAFACDGEPSRVEDAGDAETVEVDVEDSPIDIDGVDEDFVEVEDIMDSDAEEAEDGEEAEAEICPTSEIAEENPDAPGTIGGVEQEISETYEVTVECDGSELKVLLESEIALADPMSWAALDNAVKRGADSIIFGKVVRFTRLRTDISAFANHIEGATGTVGLGGSVTDGEYVVTLEHIGADYSRSSITDLEGNPVGDADLSGGQYYILPSGRILMVTAINTADSTCDIAILEAPVRIWDGGTITQDGREYLVSLADDGSMNLLAIRLALTTS